MVLERQVVECGGASYVEYGGEPTDDDCYFYRVEMGRSTGYLRSHTNDASVVWEKIMRAFNTPVVSFIDEIPPEEYWEGLREGEKRRQQSNLGPGRVMGRSGRVLSIQ